MKVSESVRVRGLGVDEAVIGITKSLELLIQT
jgi:hypothetical protein